MEEMMYLSTAGVFLGCPNPNSKERKKKAKCKIGEWLEWQI